MPGLCAPSLVTRHRYIPLGIGRPPSAASGSSSTPSAAMARAWPAALAWLSPSVKALRQSRSFSRSASVATARQSVDWVATTAFGAQAARARLAKTASARVTGESLLSRPTPVHRQVGAGDRGRGVGAEVKRQAGDLFGKDEALGRLGGKQDILHHLL